MAAIEVLRCGVGGALIEVATREQVLSLHAALRARRPEGVLELVPAALTLLVRFDPTRTSVARLRADLGGIRHDDQSTTRQRPDTVVVPVRYDGPDLLEVCAATGLSRAEVIRRHVRGEYTVAFCGFAPGFAYLTGLDPALHLPRLSSPRASVPAGSVALADLYTGVYPRSSPGGWRLIGTSQSSFWDVDREPPTLLSPGARVRFEVIGR